MKSVIHDRLHELQALAQRRDRLEEMIEELDQCDVHVIFGSLEFDEKSGEYLVPEGTPRVRLNEALLDDSDPLTEDDLIEVQHALRVVLLTRLAKTDQRIESLLARPEDPPEEDEMPEKAEPEPEKPARKPRKARENPPELPLADGKASKS